MQLSGELSNLRLQCMRYFGLGTRVLLSFFLHRLLFEDFSLTVFCVLSCGCSDIIDGYDSLATSLQGLCFRIRFYLWFLFYVSFFFCF